MTKILFVCLGNICRSPSAQAIFEDLLTIRNLDTDVLVDSAGTADYHVGKPPCEAMQRAARRRGIDMSHLRARLVRPEDFEKFDYIFAMDQANLDDLLWMAPPEHHPKISLFLAQAPDLGPDVPDPYYGGRDQAERVMDIIEEGAQTLLEHLLKTEICP
jgi:protein-tyrosine phosphatase